MVAVISLSHKTEHVSPRERGDTDFSGFLRVAGPVLAIKTDDDDVIGYVVGYFGDIANSRASHAMDEYVQITDLIEPF